MGGPEDYLRTRLSEINYLTLSRGVAALSDLVPRLVPSISLTGKRVVTQEAYRGHANLKRVALLYLSFASRCSEENAPLRTRLQCVRLQAALEALYNDSQHELDRTRMSRLFGSVRSLSETPNVDVSTADSALYFEEAQYRTLWGDEPARDERTDWNRDGTKYGTRLLASAEQVERAIARGGEILPRWSSMPEGDAERPWRRPKDGALWQHYLGAHNLGVSRL